MTISWRPDGRFAAGYWAAKGVDGVAKSTIDGKVGMRCPAAIPNSQGGAPVCDVGGSTSKQKEAELSLHPVVEQRGDQQQARAAFHTRCAIRSAIRTSTTRDT